MSDIDVARLFPQSTELHLSIYKPNTVMACQVNDAAISKGARTILYNNVSLGSYQKIVSGMTMWVGSTLGARDKGKVRVRRATSNAFTVAENSDISWANGLFLTIIDVVDIVPIFQRIVQNPANPEILYWYKDYDIAYTNQNSVLGSFICMGPHRAGQLNESGECQFWYSATGTTNINGVSLTYSWEFPGGSNITGSLLETPGYVSYQVPGHYASKLTVSGSDGSVDYSYRYVSIYPQNSEPSWELTDGQISRNAGGGTATIRIHDPYAYDIYEGAVVVLYSDEWYGGNHLNIGGNALNNQGIYFTGYVLQGSIVWNYEKSYVEFQIGSVSEVLKAANGFAISLENTHNTPTTWYQIQRNNFKKSVYHFWKWHSTVLMTTDFQFLATDRNTQYYDTNRESLFDGVNSVMKSALMAELVSDMQGKLWVENSMEATHSAFSAYPPRFTVAKDDWIGEPTIQETPYNPTSYIEMGGIVFVSNANGGSSTALLAAAPGVTPAVYGKSETPKGLALDSQTQLNQLVGDVFAYRNARYPILQMNMRGSYKVLDVAPLHVAQIQIASGDTARNIALDCPYFASELRFSYDSKSLVLKTTMVWRQVTEGVPGDTIIIPVDSPENTPFYTNISIPSFPPIWTPPPIYVPTPPAASYPALLAILVAGGGGIFYTNLDTGFYLWENANAPFTYTQLTNLAYLSLTRNGIAYVASGREVYKSLLGTNTMLTVGDEAFFQTYVPDSGPPYYKDYRIAALATDLDADDACLVVAARNYPVWLTAAFRNRPNLLGFSAFTPIQWAHSGAITAKDGKWYTSVPEGIGEGTRLRRFSYDSFVAENFLAINGPGSIIHVSARDADLIYTLDANIRRITGNGSVIDATFTGKGNGVSSIDCSITGQTLAIVKNGTPINFQISLDYGDTWNTKTLPATRACTYSQVLCLGSELDWVVSYVEATGAPGVSIQNIYRTSDGGDTWINCIGNLYDIGMPIPGPITCLRHT